jgi:hypothetical protein
MATMAIQDKRYAGGQSRAKRNKTGVALWVLQGVLALLFLFAGGVKLALPLDLLATMAPLPGLFLKLVGVLEVTGAMGLILPGLLRIRPSLTAMAGAGLVFIMVGATVVTLMGGEIAGASVPLLVGLLAAFIAYGRSKLAPLSASRGAASQ